MSAEPGLSVLPADYRGTPEAASSKDHKVGEMHNSSKPASQGVWTGQGYIQPASVSGHHDNSDWKEMSFGQKAKHIAGLWLPVGDATTKKTSTSSSDKH